MPFMELSWKSHGILFYTFRGNPDRLVCVRPGWKLRSLAFSHGNSVKMKECCQTDHHHGGDSNYTVLSSESFVYHHMKNPAVARVYGHKYVTSNFSEAMTRYNH